MIKAGGHISVHLHTAKRVLQMCTPLVVGVVETIYSVGLRS